MALYVSIYIENDNPLKVKAGITGEDRVTFEDNLGGLIRVIEHIPIREKGKLGVECADALLALRRATMGNPLENFDAIFDEITQTCFDAGYDYAKLESQEPAAKT
jgi:hypothetical protein